MLALGGAPVTVFRTYDAGEFVRWDSWNRLAEILDSNGGAFGLSGARGAGKSWLMMHAIDRARDDRGSSDLGGLGHWYPSPSEDDPHAFLASLTDSFANEIDRWYRRGDVTGLLRAHAIRLTVLATVAGLVLATIATTVLGAAASLVVAAGIAAAVLCGVAASRLLYLRSPLRRERALAEEARLVRERARYSATRREASEIGLEGGRGLLARGRRSRERELVERPATLSSLVNDFRALAQEAGDVAGRVVIAIDELDKMEDGDAVRRLLRGIKGIFEVPHVHFLVSVSDEAARSLALGALEDRNEFNSSFYTVVEVQPARPTDLAELLERRSHGAVGRDVAIALSVLAGGNPREVVRLAELAGSATTPAEAVMKALRDEALTLRKSVVTAIDHDGLPSLGEDARVGTFTSLPDSCFIAEEELLELATGALESESWEPGWQDDGFERRFGEPWRRLMVRLVVAQQLLEAPTLEGDDELADRMRSVVLAAAQSARIGRIFFEQGIRVEGAATKLGRDQARARLDELARSYEQIRGALVSSPERTKRMDDIVDQARSVVRDAELRTSEIVDRLLSEEAGNRVVGLAAVQETLHRDAFATVLAMATRPASPFEGYHALRAIESLLSVLDEHELDQLADALTDSAFLGNVRTDSSRRALSDRILQAIRMGREPAPAAEKGATAGVFRRPRRSGPS